MTDPIEQDDEDLYAYTPPAGPSPREVRAGWARTGDVDALWGLLSRSNWDAIDQEDIVKLLIEALQVQSRDPERFAADVLARMTVFTTSLLLRSHLHLASYVEHSGRAVRMRAQPPGDLPKVAVEVLIPRVVELQEHLAGLLVSQASVARQWALVKKNHAKKDDAREVKPSKARDDKRPRSSPAGRSEAPKNGQSVNRLTGLLNGHGTKANGRDDNE